MELLEVGNIIYSDYGTYNTGTCVLLHIDKLDDFYFYYTGIYLNSGKTFTNYMEYDVIRTWKAEANYQLFKNKKTAQKFVKMLGYNFVIP